jgi:hypothetical protein
LKQSSGGKNMKKYLFMLLCIIALAGFARADDYDHDNDAYRSGYQAGYQHGSLDSQARIDFNYRHAHDYRAAETDHDNYDTHESCDFRVGYVEGYADGYFHKQPIVTGNYGHGDYDNDDRYDRDGYGGGGSYPGPGLGGVTVYTAEGFRGFGRTFSVGEYPYLTGQLNDSIESIRVDGNVRVILFDEKYFRGPRVVLDRDAWNLGGFRNKAASMIIEPMGRR